MRRTYRLACLDTEATGVTTGEGTFGVLYSWDFLELSGEATDETCARVTRDNVGRACVRTCGRDVASLEDHMTTLLEEGEAGSVTWKVAVHNLSYDVGFLRHWLIDVRGAYKVDVCARSSTRLLNVSIGDGKNTYMVIFDTLALFGCSLRRLGENLGFPKLTMDYSERIAPDTRLAESNVAYNQRDTAVLMVAICQSLLKRPHVSIDNIGVSVLTKTGIVRTMDREGGRIGAVPVAPRLRGRAKRPVASEPSTIYDADRNMVTHRQFATYDALAEWGSYSDTRGGRGCYAGGVNLSNCHQVGRVLNDVISYDLKSAYPSIMLTYCIPGGGVHMDDPQGMEYLLEPMAPDPVDVIAGKLPFWRGTVEFEGLRIRDEWERQVGDTSINLSFVLQHRDSNSTAEIRHGHFCGGERVTLTLASSEFYELCLQFTWEKARFIELTYFNRYDNPTYFSVLRVLFHYREKSAAKHIQKMWRAQALDPDALAEYRRDDYITEDEYEALINGSVEEGWINDFVMSHKANLNALYGIAVTSPMRDEYELDDCGYLATVAATPEERFAAYKRTRRNGLMWRESGVCVSVLNRYKLVFAAAMLVEAGAHVVYADTDSVKFYGVAKDVADDIFTAPPGDREAYARPGGINHRKCEQ